jgi:hypothetical protein
MCGAILPECRHTRHCVLSRIGPLCLSCIGEEVVFDKHALANYAERLGLRC